MQPEKLRDALEVPLSAVWSPLTVLGQKFVAFLPSLLAAFLILLVGYVVSALLRRTTTAILGRIGFDSAARRIGLRGMLDQAGIQASAAEIIGTLVFWLFMLTFLISAAETVGLRNVSETIDAFVRYLPNVIGAGVILVVGLVISNFVRDLIRGATAGVGVDYARALSNIAYGVLVVVIATLAVGQLQIETDLLNRVVEIVLIASAGALGLALGLGTREIAKQLVAGVYARDLFRPGMPLSVDGESGSLEEIGPVCMRLRTADGRLVYVPNSRITETTVRESVIGTAGGERR